MAEGEFVVKKILIADDNKQIIDVLTQYAIKEDYQVYTAADGISAVEEFGKREYDAVLLDVMMPALDGFEVCKKIRQTSMVPIIMITARGDDYDKIMGLDIGADDYILKPFSPEEVMARLRAILRRMGTATASMQPEEVIAKGSLRIYPEKYQVFVGENKLAMTKKEVEILILLASNPDIVFSRTHILDSVWGYDYFGDTRTVDTHIKRLRAKLEQCSHPDWDIVTVRGVGYKFEVSNE